MPDAVFIDTWGWLALGHHRDARHQEVKAFYQSLREKGIPCYTTDYVLDETITLLFRREIFEEAVYFMEGIFQATEERFLTVERITSERFTSAWKLRKRLQDKSKISSTDFTLWLLWKKRE